MDSVNQQWNFWLAKEQQQKQPQNNTATHTNTTNTRSSVDAYLNCFILTNNIFKRTAQNIPKCVLHQNDDVESKRQKNEKKERVLQMTEIRKYVIYGMPQENRKINNVKRKENTHTVNNDERQREREKKKKLSHRNFVVFKWSFYSNENGLGASTTHFRLQRNVDTLTILYWAVQCSKSLFLPV